MVADVSMGVGQMAMMVPSPNGLLMGASTIAFGSVVNVMKELLQTPFHWELETDRSDFIALNCSFFDLRKELEANDFFKIKEETINAKVAEGLSFIGALKRTQDSNDDQRRAFLEHVSEVRKAYIQKTLGSDFFSYLETLRRVMSRLDEFPSDEFSRDAQLNFILILLQEGDALRAFDLLRKKNFSYARFLENLLQDFTEDRLAELSQMEHNRFYKVYVAPLRIYLKDAFGFLMKEEDQMTKNFMNHKVLHDGSEQSHQELIDHAEDVFNSIEDRLENYVVLLNRRLSILNLRKTERQYDDNDDGAHITFDIISEYQAITDLIFGKRGYSFLSYLMGVAKKQSKKFKTGYEQWIDRYDGGSKGDRAWACRDANKLRILWDQARSALEVGEDFIATNRGIVGTNVPRFKYFLYFLPTGRSPQRKFYLNMMAMEKAKMILAGDSNVTRSDVRRYREKGKKNLGILALDVDALEFQRRQIEAFVERHDCRQYF